MIKDLKNSVQSIFYERVSSPFFGTLISSWLIWNWRIIYLTFFIDSNEIDTNKIDYIVTHYSNLYFLICYPLLSTIILLTIVPFVSNAAYWLDLRFKAWKIDQKGKVEKEQRLTVEQSIQLRKEIVDMEKIFNELLKGKDDEISQLKGVINNLKEPSKNNSKQTKKAVSNNDGINDIIKLINENDQLKDGLTRLNEYLQRGNEYLSSKKEMTTKIIIFFESNDIIKNVGEGMYKMTDFGRKINKIIASQNFGKKK